jgi:DivIVA protein
MPGVPSAAARRLRPVSKERFRRTLRGYDPDEVEAAIEARDARLARLEHEAQRLAERVVEREKRLQEALARLGEASPRAIGLLGRRIEDIYAQARRQATRIRMNALEDAVQISDRVSELSRLRDELGARVAELAGLAGIRVSTGEERRPVGTQPDRGDADGVYAGPVEVEVGPLADFAQLTGFEDAAAGIDGASEIRVRRFTAGRATVSMKLGEPVELLRELEERAPFEFKVRDTRNDGVILDLDDDAPEPRRAA